MKNKIKLSIGIPAFNEAGNIKKLLNSILNQIEKDYSLLEIIVVSDGSTDSTISEVRGVKSIKIKLIQGTARIGKSQRVNQILQLFRGDVLFLIDADIKIRDILSFTKIINNNDFHKAGLVGINAQPAPAKKFFQKVVNAGMIVSKQISSEWNWGQNYLSFKGCFLGLGREFAKKAELKSSIVNNDAFFYFKAKQLGYKPVFYKEAHVFFNTPRNFKDNLSQSKRFTGSKVEMQNIFKKNLESEYAIPRGVYAKVIFLNLLQNPIYFISYMILKLITLVTKGKEAKSTWNIAVSTK